MTLLVLIVALALAGWLVGDLLGLAAWAALSLALLGAVAGYLLYSRFAKVRDRID